MRSALMKQSITANQQHAPFPEKRKGREELTNKTTIDLHALEHDLHEQINGEVRFDAGALALYATDGSQYRQVPLGVVVPRDCEDVIKTVATCREYGAPIVMRGGGTSLAGQGCNVAVVIDLSKYMHHILDLDSN